MRLLMAVLVLAVLVPQAARAADAWSYPTGDLKNPFGGGNGTKDDPYIISNAQHLANLAHMVAYKDKDYKGEYFLLTSDIVLNDNVLSDDLVKDKWGAARYADNKAHFDRLKKWTPMGDRGNLWDSYFSGIFDGDGHSISGLYIREGFVNGKQTDSKGANSYHGLFGYCNNAIIRNLTIKDSYMTAYEAGDVYPGFYGFVSGKSFNTVFDNCHVENCMMAGDPSFEYGPMWMGGIVGRMRKGYITDCSFDGILEMYAKKHINTSDGENKYQPAIYAGGLVGYYMHFDGVDSEDDDVVRWGLATNCYTSGKLVVNADETLYEGAGTAYIGGMMGCVSIPVYSPLKWPTLVKACSNGMDIYAYDQANEDFGLHVNVSGLLNVSPYGISNYHMRFSLEQCANYGNIYYGCTDKPLQIVKTNPELTRYISGIGNWVTLKDCANYGSISVAHFTSGGGFRIGGLMAESTDLQVAGGKLNTCLNSCAINYRFDGGTPHVDPNVADNVGDGDVKACYYNVAVNGSDVSTAIPDGCEKLGQADFADMKFAQRLNAAAGSIKYGVVQNAASRVYGYVLPVALGASINEMSGEGSADKPYLIYSANDLKCMADMCASAQDLTGKVFRLADNIYMDDSGTLKEIGSQDDPFTGIFDGNGHYISGLKSYTGSMFGYIGGGAEIKNLALLNAQPADDGGFYGIAFYVGVNNESASIHDCYVTADIERATSGKSFYMGGICGAVSKGGKVENCYFSGSLKMKNSGSASARVCGIAHTNGGTVSNCHAVLSYQDDGTQDTNESVGAFYQSSSTQSSCYMALSLPQSNFGVTDKRTFSGVTMCGKEEDIDWQKLGADGWMAGRYHPVLRKAFHYVGMFKGAETGLDPVERNPQDNVIMTVTPSADNVADNQLWLMQNVAVYTETYNGYLMLNFALNPDKPIVYDGDKRLISSTSYTVTAQQGDNWFSLCLPGVVRQRSLPDGSKLFVGGTLSNNRMNIVEVDSVPAGVPFLLYCHADEARSFCVKAMDEFKTTPVTAASNSSLQGTFGKISDAAAYCSKVAVADGRLYLTKETDGMVKGYTGYVDNGGADVELTQYLLLDEQDNQTAETLAANSGQRVGIKLLRDIKTGGWNTLCLPFDVTVAELRERLGETTQVETLAGVNYDAQAASVVLSFNVPADETVKAGTPFLLYAEKAASLFDFDARTIANTVNDISFDGVSVGDGTLANISLTGSFGKQLLASSDEANIYFIQRTTLYRAGSANPVPMLGFRCWLSVTNADGTAAQALHSARIVHADGTATTVGVVDMGAAADGSRIYDLQGIEHGTMQRGLNLVGGKKIVKK